MLIKVSKKNPSTVVTSAAGAQDERINNIEHRDIITGSLWDMRGMNPDIMQFPFKRDYGSRKIKCRFAPLDFLLRLLYHTFIGLDNGVARNEIRR